MKPKTGTSHFVSKRRWIALFGKPPLHYGLSTPMPRVRKPANYLAGHKIHVGLVRQGDFMLVLCVSRRWKSTLSWEDAVLCDDAKLRLLVLEIVLQYHCVSAVRNNTSTNRTFVHRSHEDNLRSHPRTRFPVGRYISRFVC